MFCGRRQAKREVEMLEARLPIYRYKRKIRDTVRDNAITLLMAETGAGKSTQVVQYLHQLFQVAIHSTFQLGAGKSTQVVKYTVPPPAVPGSYTQYSSAGGW